MECGLSEEDRSKQTCLGYPKPRSFAEPRYYAKALLSAIDGALAAEEARSFEGGRSWEPPLTLQSFINLEVSGGHAPPWALPALHCRPLGGIHF